MEIDQTSLFAFLGVSVSALLGYLTIRTQQVHKLVNTNFTKQTELIAADKEEKKALNDKIENNAKEAAAKIESTAKEHAAKIEGMNALIAELNRRLPPAPQPMVVGSVDPVPPEHDQRVLGAAPKGTTADPVQIEIVSQSKPVEVDVIEADKPKKKG